MGVGLCQIYEEISAQQVDEVKPKKTFKDNEIGTGDIIVVQKVARERVPSKGSAAPY